MGRVYAVASAKGGVGKTTTVANLGAVLARNGYRTAVVDVDLGMANVAQVLGVDPTETLHDVLAGEAKLEDAVYQGPNGLAVVPGATDLDAFRSARPEDLGSVVEPLRENSDFVLLDVGAGLSHDTVLPLDFADEVILVAMPGQIALEGAEKTGEIAERLGVPVAGLVLVRGSGDDVEPTTLASIPDAPEMAEAIEAGVPLVERDPDAPASRAYRQLTAELTGVDVDVDVAGDQETSLENDDETSLENDDETSLENDDEPDRDDGDGVERAGATERDLPDEDATEVTEAADGDTEEDATDVTETVDEATAEEGTDEEDSPEIPDGADSTVDEAGDVTFGSERRESTTDADDGGVVVDQPATDEGGGPAPDAETEVDDGDAVDGEDSDESTDCEETESGGSAADGNAEPDESAAADGNAERPGERADAGEEGTDGRPPSTDENADSTDAPEEAGSEERSERRAAGDPDGEEEDDDKKGFLDRLLR